MNKPSKAAEHAHRPAGPFGKLGLITAALAALLAAVSVYLVIPSQTGEIEAMAAPSANDVMAPGPLPENTMGSASAPVTLIEYASMTCSHCAAFHKEVLPGLKKKYIDTGKVRYILREFPGDNVAFSISALARCAGEPKYFAFVDAVFSTYDSWSCRECDVKAELTKLWKQAGKSQAEFDTCLDPKANKVMLDGIQQIRNTGLEKFGVNATPTIFINGKKHEGPNTLDGLEKAIDPLLKG